MKFTKFLLLAGLWLVGPVVTSVGSAEPDYTFQALDVPAELGGGTSAYGINNSGMIVGNFITVDWKFDGFLFQRGEFTDVAVQGAALDYRGPLSDVNDLGQAVGTFIADAETGAIRSFVRSRTGQITMLPEALPGAQVTEATGINNLGVIVGFVIDADGQYHGWVLREGEFTTYDYPGARRTLFTRINDRGQIAGIWADADRHAHGFVLTNRLARSIEVPGAVHTRCTGINNWGEIVGWYHDADLIAHGFLLRGDKFTDINFPGAADSAALGINDHGEIAGTYDGFTRGMVAVPNH